MTALSPRPAAPAPGPVPFPLLAFCAIGWTALLVLFAGISPPAWLLPLALAGAGLWWWRDVGRVPAAQKPPRAHWSFGSWLVALAVAGGAAAIAWGCLATPERSWDGFSTWGLVARQLLAGETLASPSFADPAVFAYTRGYPLLLPVCMQQLGAWWGADGARLVHVAIWLSLLAGVRSSVLAAGGTVAAAGLGVLGTALLPMFVEPGHGSAESGFADLLVAALVAFAARAVLARSIATAVCVGLLLPVAKNEGALHLALWIAVAAAWRERAVAAALAAGGGAALLAWLPVQQRLMHPGADAGITAMTFAPLLLLAGAGIAGDVAARRGWWGKAAVVLVPVLAAVALPGQIRQILGGAEARLDFGALPRVAGELLAQAGWLRKFGATFPLLLAAAWFAWRERARSARWRLASPLLTAQVLFAFAIAGFLAMLPEVKRALFVREGLNRYLAQLLGVAWIAIPLLLLRPRAELPAEVPAPRAGAETPRERPRWLSALLPPGSRRDRLAWITLVTLRKLPEGPGPWLRAVQKGLFQLLPVRLRNLVLRWSGEEQFFRRHEPRHASADAGVEQPGLVSVVLPVFDQADLLGASIESVLAQTYSPFELIVVDDGSRDGVRDVLARWLGDPRVRVLTQPNQGLPKALSTGFEFARGEFFTWTSADNLMHSEQLTKLVACLRQRSGVAMVWADYELIDDRGAPLVGGEFRVLDRTDPANPAVVRTKRTTDDLNRYEDNFIGPCFLYRGRVGRLLGDYNPELGLEDYDYWMRINRLFRVEHLGTDDVLYRYRVHDNTLSARARELRILERAKVLMEHERRRAAWVAAPLRVLADAESRRWLEACVRAPDTLEALPDDPLAALPVQKTLVVVDGSNLPRLAAAGAALPPHVAIAAFFGDAEAVHRAHAALRAPALVAFGVDADVVARLAVHRRESFAEPPGEAAFGLAVRHAANATFARSTVDAERRARVVPSPFTAGPLAVLLQVERFGRGGLERVVLDLAAELLAAGHRVGLLALDGSAAGADLDDAAGAEIVAPPADAAGYAAMLRDGGWQLVDAHASTTGAEVATAAGVPFVQTVHNSYVWYGRAEIERLRAADAHTAAYACVSAQALGYLDLRVNLDVGKMLVLENGIRVPDGAVFAPERRAAARAALGLGERDVVLLQVASIQPAKAHRAAVHALAELRARLPHARLVCLGDVMHPVLAAQVRADVERLGLHDAVLFLGHRADAGEAFAAADVFVLPSFWEGCSLAVWEAIAAGLPLLLSDVGAAAEQLQHGHGELVAPPVSPLELDGASVDAVVQQVDEAFVARLAAAMERAVALPRRASGKLPTVAQRATMARRKAKLFAWLLQGGGAAAARAMVAREADPAASS